MIVYELALYYLPQCQTLIQRTSANILFVYMEAKLTTAQSENLVCIRNHYNIIENPDWLPEDWVTIEVTRQEGNTAGLIDKYYFAPDGKKYRSQHEVERFVKSMSNSQFSLTD
jgi:hypothetical protein